MYSVEYVQKDIETLKREVTDLHKKHSDMVQTISEIKTTTATSNTHLEYIKEKIDSIQTKLTECPACTDSKYLFDKAKSNRKDIEEIKKDISNSKIKIYGITLAINSTVAFLLFAKSMGWI